MKLSVKNLTLIAVIAALYTAITFIFAGVSYGPVQFRISEFLNALSFFSFVAVPGLTLGCFVSNLLGLFLGAEGACVPDLIIGTLATFIAAVMCYYIGKSKSKFLIYVFGFLPVVLINGLFVGYELTYLLKIGGTFIFNCSTVALGELVVCYGLGSFLTVVLFRNDLYKKLF